MLKSRNADVAVLLLLENDPGPRPFQVEAHAALLRGDMHKENTELAFRLLELSVIHRNANQIVCSSYRPLVSVFLETTSFHGFGDGITNRV